MGDESTLQGIGLGLRRPMLSWPEGVPSEADFLEVAPENWIGVDGWYGEQLRFLSGQLPIVAHGLSLSIGGGRPLDTHLLDAIGRFLETYQVPVYSEHLSYTGDEGHLYDLLPLPFTDEAVRHVVQRIRQVQEHLGRRLVLENVSYYLTSQHPMSEVEFLCAVLDEADCELLLDVNNVYVNSINHEFDALEFIRCLPAERVRYLHVAGHYVEEDGVIVDTHGADVSDPVWELLAATYHHIGERATLLERDFNLPSRNAVSRELQTVRQLYEGASHAQQRVA